MDGSLILYRGDITRDRSSRMKVLKDGNSPITGLSFKSTANNTILFVATTTSIFLYNITHKDKENKITLDNAGAAYKCNVLAESLQDGHFMIGRNDVRSLKKQTVFYYFIRKMLFSKNLQIILYLCFTLLPRQYIVTQQMVGGPAMQLRAKKL